MVCDNNFENKNLRKRFINFMKSKKIECRPMIFPVSFASHFKVNLSQNYPKSYDVSLRSLHLPSINLTSKTIKYICKTINSWDNNLRWKFNNFLILKMRL